MNVKGIFASSSVVAVDDKKNRSMGGTMERTTLIGFRILLLVALLGIAVAPVSVTNAQGGVWAEINAASLNVREGPGVDSPAIGVVSSGARLEVLGVHPASGWIEIVYADGPDGKGWISGSDKYVTIQGSLAEVQQVVDVPAAPKTTESTVEATAEATPSASADGLQGKLVFQTSSGGDIYLVNADGTGLRKLTTGMDPALSPDGTQVAFARWEGIPRGLYVINTDGSDERLVYGWDQGGLKSPTWSPDGKRLAFSLRTGDSSQDQFFVRVPDGSGDSTKVLAFEGNHHPWWKICAINLDGKDFQQLQGHDYSYSPSWATNPDDKRIVYSSDKGVFITGDAEGMGSTLDDPKHWLITDYQNDRSPAWSPDGHRIVFQTKSHDHWEIVVVNDDGQGRTQITRSWPLADVPVNSVAPAWSPDGKWIAFLTDERGKWELWRMRDDGSDRQPFLEDALKDIPIDYQYVDERVVSWGP